MMNSIHSLFISLLVLLANAVVAQDVESIINEAPNQEANWSITVRDANGSIIEAYQPDKLIIPASNQKLFTTAAILHGLGSDYTYTTHIYGDGTLRNDSWDGSLIIQGVGDPSISGFLYGEDRDYVFRSFSNQLKNKGITNITNMMFADSRYFDNQVYPKGWDWDDLSFYYGVEIQALSFNNNAIDLTVLTDGRVGSTPEITWYPDDTDYVYMDNQQLITRSNTEYDEFYQREMGTNSFLLKSTLPQKHKETESLSIYNAPIFFVYSLQNYLKNDGIQFPRARPSLIAEGWKERPMEILASHTSKPLSELVEWANKESDNFYTEMMLKTLAAEKTNKPGTFENGIKEVRKFLGGMGIDTTYVIMKDGSGMASGNFTKTSILSEFLANMQVQKEFPVFYNSLSIAGIDGTIAHRMKGTPLYNNFKGKSGYVGGVRTLSGYFTTASGERLIVSLSANNFIGKVRPIDAVHEEILAYLYAKY